jgi:3-phenylpropionate/trans-cinnamate dioxygenase ferredoxin reductase subunit
LSKSYLTAAANREALWYRPHDFYQRRDVKLCTGMRVEAIDRAAAELRLGDGSRCAYDVLVLATGARARKLEVDGDAADEVMYLRSLHDADRLSRALVGIRNVVIVGGGFIGLEVAASLVARGIGVRLLVAQERVLHRQAPKIVSEYLEAVHRQRGVDIRCGVRVDAVERFGNGCLAVIDNGGGAHTADLVVAGIGARPNVKLAMAAGLDCDDGVLVDEYGGSSAAGIYAAGDCARHFNTRLNRWIRPETVHNAVEQARAAASGICGRTEPYRQVPWVWSDQYDLRLQSVGITTGEQLETVARGQDCEGQFSVYCFEGSELLGMSAVRCPLEFAAIRRLIDSGQTVSRDRLLDSDFDVRKVAPKAGTGSFNPAWPARVRKD